MSMFRAGLLRNAFRPVALKTTRLSQPTTASAFYFQRANFASGSGLSKDNIQARVLDVLKGFEKVDPAKIQPSASFAQDLGLDSLDAVEVVMAIEEEFSVQIPDAEADEIATVQQAIDYIAKTPEAH